MIEVSTYNKYAGNVPQLKFLGTWNANINNPYLESGIGQYNGYYIINTAGTTNLDGITSWAIGDIALFNGSVWTKQPAGSLGLNYLGLWDANTNTPALTSGTGTNQTFYIVNVAGSTNLDGINSWKYNDWAVFEAGRWFKIDNSTPTYLNSADFLNQNSYPIKGYTMVQPAVGQNDWHYYGQGARDILFKINDAVARNLILHELFYTGRDIILENHPNSLESLNICDLVAGTVLFTLAPGEWARCVYNTYYSGGKRWYWHKIPTGTPGIPITTITDGSIISEITDPANWDTNGDFIGSPSGLIEGNIYIDGSNKIKYEYFSGVLLRYNFNNII